MVSKTPTSSPLIIKQRPLKRINFFSLILINEGGAISRPLNQQSLSCSNLTTDTLKKV